MPETIVAIKSVKQAFSPTPELLEMMETFRKMVNDCIRIGIQNDVSTRARLSKLCYHTLSRYHILSYFKVSAINKAVGILATRKKSIRRKHETKIPYIRKPYLLSHWGFTIENGHLNISMPDTRSKVARHISIKLSEYILNMLSQGEVRAFAISESSLSIVLAKEREISPINQMIGVDRNLNNLTVGNYNQAVQYDLSKAVTIGETTTSVLKSFKRSDVRIGRELFRKYGQRRKNRVDQLLHHVSKDIVRRAKENKQAIVFEDIRGVRKGFSKGNFGKALRRQANTGWPFYEIKRQIEYKAAWQGVKTITVSKASTKYTSTTCPQCGERLQEGKDRRVWCAKCQRWMDRDVVAVMNLSYYGRAWFARSEGLAEEAMRGNPEAAMPVILRVDASKLSPRRT